MTTTQIDPAVVEAKAGVAFGALIGAVTAGTIYLGERLGLYRAMAGAGPLTSAELAGRTGLHERWLREWLRGQAAATLLDYRGNDTYELVPEAALVLADEENPASAIGAFSAVPSVMGLFERLEGPFHTGIGLTYDDDGPAVAEMVDRMFGPWNRTALISEALPKVDGAIARLEAGVKVADVGCGAAAAIIALAKAFPKSEFHGYDNSRFALERAAKHLAEAGVTNVTIHNSDTDPLPATPTFDLVFCLDCLHDMNRPDLAAAAIRKAITPDGTWFIADIESSENFEENFQNPLAPMLYGSSIMLCMSSSSCTPDGLALGTVGLPEPKMRELVLNAGFGKLERVPGLVHPMNAYYQARL
ncbi:MAG: methyltransferase domain-containing protein [Dehalococcoidia bacterium]|nr:methyltransferase domain-containing protein [Dehalococcoidia bacterium]